MATEIALKIAPVVDGQASDLLHDHTSGSEDEQESENEEKHEKLLKEITSLSSSSKRRQKTLRQRSEPNKTVSEFHLSTVKDSSQQVELSDLIGSLNKTNEHGNLKKKLDSMQRNSGTLDVPLTKPEAEKIQRTIAYGETKRDIEKWALTVKKNREAEHLSFPLKPFEPPRPSLRGLAVNFKPRTPLEEEVAAVLRGSSHVLERSNKELTEEEEKALLAMDLEEAKERRHELQKLRALQSYYEAKCRRMKKIKSKKYHRVKRKAEMRAAAKMAAEEDPQNEDDTETLEKADRLRAMERVSLKHRNTSKWAKHLMAKGSKNAEAKKLLQEQLRISRNLTEKTAAESESEDDMEMPVPETEADVDDDGYGNLVTSEDNPWKLDTTGAPHLAEMTSSLDNDSSLKLHRLQPIRTEDADEKNDDSEPGEDEGNSEEEFELKPVSPSDTGKKKPKKKDTIEGGKKKKKKRRSEITLTESEVAAKKSKKSEKSSGKKSANSAPEHGITGDSTEGQEINLLKTKKGKKDKKKLTDKSTANSNFEEVDSVSLTDSRTVTETEDTAWTNPAVKSNGFETEVAKPKDIRVDPKKIFTIEEHEAGAEDDESGPLHQKRIDIQQAFANDDVVEEFLQEKSEIEEASKPKDIDLSLPGWGTWAGAGIKPSEKKKKQFTKKAKRGPPRKDKELSHVIINEEKSKLFAKNQVSEVPHPYGNHVQFERSVRNPVGKHWNTGTTVNQLTKPRVSTLIGTIIEPIEATKEIKRSKPEDRKKEKKKGQESSGIKIFS